MKSFYQKNKRFFLLLLVFITQHLQDSNAQSRFFLSVGAGTVYYNGDLRDKRLLPPSQLFHFIIDANVGYNINKHFDLTINYYKGKVDCADSLSNELDNIIRNQNFRSTIDEVNLMLRYKLFRIDKQHAFNPYVMAGFGWLFFKPEGYYNGQWHELQPLGTEGQYISNSEENYPKPYKLTTNSLPIGFGVMIRISDAWKIKTEFIQHYLFTDYLDDTSTKYPDSLELSATPNGYYATIFSSRRLNGFPQVRRNRGNSNANDSYTSFSAGIIYNPPRKKSYEYRHGFLYRLFHGKQGWWGNEGNGLQ